MSGKSTGGRPPIYTDEQVLAAIAIVEATGEAPESAMVKTVLCEKFGVSKGINAQSLGVAIARVVEQRDLARMQSLVASLPDHVHEAVGTLSAIMSRGVIEMLAPLNERLRADGRQAAEAKETDNAALRARLASCEAELADTRGRNEELELAKEQLQVERDRLLEERSRLRAKLKDRKREEGFLRRMEALAAQAAIGRSGTDQSDQPCGPESERGAIRGEE